MTPPTNASARTGLRRHLGFTLIEIAIGMLIVGLVAGLGLALLSAQQTQQQFSTTKARQETLRLAILGFVARNNRLPCPADPSIPPPPPANANYGAETYLTTSTTCNGLGPIPTASSTASKGIIPWVTLGIPQEAAIDGYGNYFTYLVTYTATNANVSTLTYLVGTIGLYSSSPVHPGLPVGSPSTQNQINACSATPGDNNCNLLAVAALVSYGKDGYGAYKPGAGATTMPFPTSPNVNEMTNSNFDVSNNHIALVDTGVVDITQGGFDDMVVVWNPHDILNALAFPGFIKSPRAVTNDRIDAAKRSLISYIAANGSLRAPYGSNNYAVGTSSGTINGEGVLIAIPATPQSCTLGPTSCLPWSTLGLDSTAAFDGWGTLMQFAVHPNVANLGLHLSTSNASYNSAFVIVSAGPNRVFETTNADTPIPAGTWSDDITVGVTVGELRGLLMQTGVTVPP